MHDGLAKIQDVPSVIYGKVRFNPETRRVQAANYKYLVVARQRFRTLGRQQAERPAL